MAKVMQWGFGAMGSGMVRLMLERKGIELVGVIDLREEYQGKDVGDILGLGRKLGVLVSNDPVKVLEEKKPDITLVATGSFVDDVYDQVKLVMEHGSNCITTAEEMAYPWYSNPKQAKELDEIAKKNNVSLLGTGVNPGFVLDLLVLTLSGVCGHVDKVKAARINDLSPFGPTVMKTQGVGSTVEEFEEGLKKGTIVGHIGFQQSIAMVADALGWKLDEIVEERIPIVSKTHRETPYITVEPGMVAGCRQLGYGMMNGKAVIEMEHPQQIHPEIENVDTGDYITIEGDVPINMANKPEIQGGKGTINVMVNMIPHVLKGRPGLLTMVDLPVPMPFKSL